MIRNIFLIVCCFFVAGFLKDTNASKGPLEKTGSAVWDTADAICHDNDDLIDNSAGSDHISFIRIVEYTKLSSHSHSVFPSAADSLMKSTHFNPDRMTVIFIHSFTDSPKYFSGQSFAMAYKMHGDYNILALDSSKLIKMFYKRSANVVKYIGEALGVIIYDLVSKGVALENIHLVGHSLGAHIAGFAGKSYQFLNAGQKLPRITGMDPAGPCFFHADSDHRLDKEDAEFVDVIHTNIGVYGINKTIGHVDFYPNGGGLKQPGCFESICSHNRVWKFYEESILRPNAFIASRCDSWEDFDRKRCDHNEKVVMGEDTPSTARGVFFLRTNFLAPFGLGEVGSMAGILSGLFN